MAVLYPGIEMLLSKLKEKNYKIGMATLKAEKFAKIMLSELGVDSYFDAVCGMDEDDRLTKALLIEKCCNFCDVEKSKTILIGDSNNDLLGAKEAGVHFVGVTYGFGFSKDEKYCFDSAHTTEEVLSVIENQKENGECENVVI
ncbi:haloacid dehalogenase-like hydrolase [Marvinbryantia formatexigens]|nr:haloacid dehalogenase-like hydrolase [Marvinbryantia formatexigens]